MAMLCECKNISKEYGDRQVLKHINFQVYEGQKIGIVGDNGCGKTTLINILMGRLEPTSGECMWSDKDLQIGYMTQERGEINAQLTLSGGEETKKVLTELLYTKKDVLILDEPTNHLDYEGLKWLIKQLKAFKGTVIVISHDRYFLDSCVTQIIEIDKGENKIYKGNYSWYREEKRRQYEIALNKYLEEERLKGEIQNQIKQLRTWSNKAHRDSRKNAILTGNKFGGKEHNRMKAKKMDKAIKSRIKRLEKIEFNSDGRPEEEIKVLFEVGQVQKHGEMIVSAKEIKKAYGEKLLFEKSSFYIKRGEKVGIYGKNGCGKTTLIKALLGEVEIEGELKLSKERKLGYISQKVIDLEESVKLLDLFEVTSQRERAQIRTALAQMGFGEDSLNKYVGDLSLGERMKLKLLLMIRGGCEVLILDEPTNHIDLHVREQLEEVLEAYTGTIILITHDRYMLERLCNKLLVFENKKIQRYEYGLHDYLEHLKNYGGGEDCKVKQSKKKALEEQLCLENKIAYLVGALSTLEVGSNAYIEMENQYMQLMKLRNKINK